MRCFRFGIRYSQDAWAVLETVGIDVPFCVHVSSMPGDYLFDEACQANLRGNLPGKLPFFRYEHTHVHLNLIGGILDKYSYCFWVKWQCLVSSPQSDLRSCNSWELQEYCSCLLFGLTCNQ